MTQSLAKLTEQQKTIIINGYKDNIPNRVIAEQIGVPYEHVKKLAQKLGCSKSAKEANAQRRISITHWYEANGLKLGKPYEPVNS